MVQEHTLLPGGFVDTHPASLAGRERIGTFHPGLPFSLLDLTQRDRLSFPSKMHTLLIDLAEEEHTREMTSSVQRLKVVFLKQQLYLISVRAALRTTSLNKMVEKIHLLFLWHKQFGPSAATSLWQYCVIQSELHTVTKLFPLFFHFSKAISSVHVKSPKILIQITLKDVSSAPIQAVLGRRLGSSARAARFCQSQLSSRFPSSSKKEKKSLSRPR